MKQLLFLFLFVPIFIQAQFGNKSLPPESWKRDGQWITIATKEIKADDSEIEKLKEIQHASYICATAIPSQIKFSDFTLAEILPNNDKVFRLMIKSPEALGMMLMFENFRLQSGAKLWLYNKEKTHFAGMYSDKDNYQSNGEFLTSHVLGSEIIIEYIEPATVKTQDFSVSKVYHYFRGLKSGTGNGFGTAGSCMINVACSEGNVKPAARDAACRIRVTGPSFSGFCTGTLVNNTSEDKTPYILTANHCSAKSSLSDLINWEFDFLFQSPACSNPSIEPPALTYKGCTAPAYSGSDNGEFSSDFLLLKLSSNLNTSTYDFTFLGWNRVDSNFWGNYCYHHPKGDIKKVSTSLNWTSIASYGGNVPNTHLSLTWTQTSNGHSVTDEGSSGSGLVNSQGLLIGTLTGGSALCSNLSGIDFYGRLFTHWDKFGSANNQRVKPWLDPINSGVTFLRSLKLSGATVSVSSNLDTERLNYKLIENNLKLSWLDNGYEVNLYNSIGQKLTSVIAQGKETSLDMTGLTKGLYIIEVLREAKREIIKISW
jgi:hypothetical protein